MLMFLEVVTALCALLFFYHHFIYPKLLPWLGLRRQSASVPPTAVISHTAADLAFITVILPCFNEQQFIADKLFNFAYVDYPTTKFKVILCNDGSTDQTLKIYQQTIQHPLLQHVQFELRDFKINRGKIAMLNEVVAEQPAGLLCLSDVSALISMDAFLRINQHMQDPRVGVVAASYGLLNPGSAGEAAYWDYQIAIKQAESAMGSTLGVHGALYCIRAELFRPLPADSINDDFMIPMQVITQGYRVLYDTQMIGVELEQSTEQLDFHRRTRIAAGNVQQVLRLHALLHPRHGAVAFNFFSGKFLRVLMPWCMLLMLLGSLILATQSYFFLTALGLQLLVYLLAALGAIVAVKQQPKVVKLLNYLVKGHVAAGVGWWFLMKKSASVLQWRKVSHSAKTVPYLPLGTRWGKRLFDVVVASGVLMLTLPLWLVIAMAIRMESKGPVFFQQLRIGESDDKYTRLFYMIKFRSMVQDAERETGAVWAGKNDCRVTKVGRFLRNTRLDELPQMLNVLKGEMSLVGPRPERPELCGRIEQQIPFFCERTCHVRPGITGLAQVNLGYDSCMDDVRKKVMFDHSYALALHTTKSWLLMDLAVLAKTFVIMVLGRGQ